LYRASNCDLNLFSVECDEISAPPHRTSDNRRTTKRSRSLDWRIAEPRTKLPIGIIFAAPSVVCRRRVTLNRCNRYADRSARVSCVRSSKDRNRAYITARQMTGRGRGSICEIISCRKR
jgi:hypothetical protein